MSENTQAAGGREQGSLRPQLLFNFISLPSTRIDGRSQGALICILTGGKGRAAAAGEGASPRLIEARLLFG